MMMEIRLKREPESLLIITISGKISGTKELSIGFNEVDTFLDHD